jgi:competence protein ComEC
MVGDGGAARRGRRAGWAVALLLLVAACGGTDDGAVGAGPGGAEPAAPATGPDPDDADARAEDEATDPDDPDDDVATDLAPERDEPDVDEDPAPDPEAPTSPAVEGELAVHHLDVGQGDATLLVHDDATVLIDTGTWQASDVVAHLAAHDVDALDLVVVTHPHADHLGQFDQVLDAVDVAEVWWSGSEATTRTFERAVDALEASEAAYEEPRAGDVTTIGPLQVEIVNPPVGVELTDLHDASLALRVSYGEVTLLFTGDAEAATEARMVAAASEVLTADVLQLGHHGSSTSTTSAFLDAVAPTVAIASTGAGNSYGHPHAEVLDRLAAADVETFDTAVHGTVTVTTDGETFAVTTERDGEVVPGDRGGSDGGDGRDGGEPDDGAAGGAGGSGQDAARSPSASGDDACGAGQVDVNAAPVEALQEIVHIGPARADDLVGLRPFGSLDALDRIDGIGPARLADIVEQGVACVG